jgi:hypothetical protein
VDRGCAARSSRGSTSSAWAGSASGSSGTRGALATPRLRPRGDDPRVEEAVALRGSVGRVLRLPEAAAEARGGGASEEHESLTWYSSGSCTAGL